MIDELRIWSIARSRAEIDAAARTPLDCDQRAIVGRYAFDEADGTQFQSCNESAASNVFGIGNFTRVASPFDD